MLLEPPSSLTDCPSAAADLTRSPSLRILGRLPYPDLQYIFVDFSTRIKTCAADPLCFFPPLSIPSDPIPLLQYHHVNHSTLSIGAKTRASPSLPPQFDADDRSLR